MASTYYHPYCCPLSFLSLWRILAHKAWHRATELVASCVKTKLPKMIPFRMGHKSEERLHWMEHESDGRVRQAVNLKMRLTIRWQKPSTLWISQRLQLMRLNGTLRPMTQVYTMRDGASSIITRILVVHTASTFNVVPLKDLEEKSASLLLDATTLEIHGNLSQLSWEKVLVYIEAFNAHGSIVCRQKRFDHPGGRAVIQHFVDTLSS